jgi:hypothetical protein
MILDKMIPNKKYVKETAKPENDPITDLIELLQNFITIGIRRY